MPMGGIGAGSISLTGYGALQDFSIRHKPDTTAMPDGHSHSPAAFALLHIKGRRPVTRLLEGPLPVERIYDQGLQAQGYRKGGYEGMPRFARATFSAQYPFGHVDLSSPGIPVHVRVTGWSPLVPGDETASGIPGAIVEYTLRNTSNKSVACELSYHLSHLAVGKQGESGTRNCVMPGKGVLFTNTEPAHEATFGSASLSVLAQKPRIKAMWLRQRAGTYASITALWREASEGRFTDNAGNNDRALDGRNGGSVLVALRLKSRQQVTVPILITWHFPNVYDTVGQPKQPAAEKKPDACGCATGNCMQPEPRPAWQPWYVNRWANAQAVAGYLHDNYASLQQRTRAFTDALWSSTLPGPLIDAIASNLAILKSPTLLRQSSGNVWGWEGCFCQSGCCHGSCTHVWNYAQALPHLFPALERTLREQELERSLDDRGHATFRAALPDGPTDHDWHAAADGQLGGLLKLYREWQICGDTDWLRRLYPQARRSLEYCIATWDPNRQGALFEPHHNTYDIEFWGPDGMCTSIYCAALAAVGGMAAALGEDADAGTYRQLAEVSATYLEKNLFANGYFAQKVMWNELDAAASFRKTLGAFEAVGNEVARILKAEGPRYQYGSGCLSDGVIGAWMARIYGIPTPQRQSLVRKHLQSIYRHNFRADLSEHVCLQRPGYALGHEGGLILCTWPHGNKPTLPFVYSDEVWTGIEYQVASHMIAMGLVDPGVRIVQAARKRYDGHTRNPFNEYECGNYYARAMSSYALLGAYSGFRYSAVTKTLWLDPQTTRRPFRTFFSAQGAHGVIDLSRTALRVCPNEGELEVHEIRLGKHMLACHQTATSRQPLTVALAHRDSKVN